MLLTGVREKQVPDMQFDWCYLISVTSSHLYMRGVHSIKRRALFDFTYKTMANFIPALHYIVYDLA